MLRLGPFRRKMVARATVVPRSGIRVSRVIAGRRRRGNAGLRRLSLLAPGLRAVLLRVSGELGEGTLPLDRFGLTVTTRSARALSLYVEAVDRILSANAGAEALLSEAVALDPGFALAHVALARNAQLYGRMDEARGATWASAK